MTHPPQKHPVGYLTVSLSSEIMSTILKTCVWDDKESNQGQGALKFSIPVYLMLGKKEGKRGRRKGEKERGRREEGKEGRKSGRRKGGGKKSWNFQNILI